MGETIPHWLTKQAELKPNQLAIELVDGQKLTFLELYEQSQQFARKLSSVGVSKGQHIGVLSTNNVTMIIAIHALSYLGAVGVLLNTRLTTSELQYQIDQSQVSLIIAADHLSNKMNTLNLAFKVTFSDVETMKEAKVALQSEINLSDPFTIIYTSGTTGFPKGVVHTYGNHWWSAIASALNLGLSSDDKWLAVLPFFHVGGLSIFLKSVIYGMPVYLLEKFDTSLVQKAIMEKQVTMVSVVTVMMQRLLVELGDNNYPETFRCMLLGGGSASESILHQAKKARVPVFQSYGLTETSSQIVTLSPVDALRKLGSAGKPLTPAQLEIDANEGEVGEIFVKGPMITNGYYENIEANITSFKNYWLKTGDMGYLDEEGFLYVVDRRSDLIISGGENIYPSEIENILSQIGGVNEVAVTSKGDPKWGEVPVAFIVQNETVTKIDVVTYAQTHLASYKIPHDIYFVSDLPRNASNKVIRYKLKDWL